MNRSVYNPAIGLLLKLQTRAKVCRLTSRLLRPRRLALTALAAVLLCAWIANAVASVMLREATEVNSLRSYLALALSSYGLWHLVRVACFRPAQPLGTTAEVHEILAECPLSPAELIGHHLAGTFAAALFKSGCVTLLLLPDLGSPLLGFVGILLALWFLDLVRIALEILAWGMSRRSFYVFRTTIIGAVIAICVMSVDKVREATVGALAVITHENPLESIEIFFGRLRDTPFTEWCTWAWHWVLEVIATERLDMQSTTWLAISCAIVGTLLVVLVALYGRVLEWVAQRERDAYQARLQTCNSGKSGLAQLREKVPATAISLKRVIHLRGAGPLAWRQMIGASRHLGGLFTAMAVPGVLSLVPACAPVSNEAAFMSVVCGLAFYSFILMPTALRFDFRRDLERIALVKALPISPFASALGQISTPALVATLFQVIVMTIALIARPVPVELVVGATTMLCILNVFIFSLENLIFLWYPHRLQQEGIEIFLRTTLTFTAKGLVFLIALAVFVAWSVPARYLAEAWTNFVGIPVSAYLVYFLGIQFLLCTAAAVLTWLLASAFGSFDPAEDTPA